MKRKRPYIPLAIRCMVLTRQIYESGTNAIGRETGETLGHLLKRQLAFLFGDRATELHHRPALCNRPWSARKNDYDPPANDPDYLVYLAADDHDIETRVRGIGAQRSDLSQRRYNKKVARNRTKGRKRKAFPQGRKLPRGRKLQSRPFRQGGKRAS